MSEVAPSAGQPGEPVPKSRAGRPRWSGILEETTDPLFLLNRQRRLVQVNAAWQALTGISCTEARGLVCRYSRRAAPGSREALLQVLDPPPSVWSGQPGRCQRRVIRAGGLIQIWEIAFLPLCREGEVLGVLGRIQVAPAETRGTSTLAGPLAVRLAPLRDRLLSWHSLDHLDSALPAIRRVQEQVQLAAPLSLPVLLWGEPGTGKRWTARTLHHLSPRSASAFAILDCQHLPASLLEALLLEEAGLLARPGISGLYLHQPQYLPREIQARLADWLRAPPETSLPRCRLFLGCDTDPQQEVQQGRLLEDWYCRCSALTIWLPPLRQRLSELPLLVRRFLKRLTGAAPGDLTAAAWDTLHSWSWPENLRELYTVLQSASQRAEGKEIDVVHLPWYLRAGSRPPATELPLRTLLQEAERRLICLALERSGYNKSKAARLLGVWRNWLIGRIRQLGIQQPHPEGTERNPEGTEE